MEPEPVADYACEVGEGPLWHPLENRLYWGDIPQGRMFRYDPVTGHHEQFYDGPVVGGLPYRRTAACCCSWRRAPSQCGVTGI